MEQVADPTQAPSDHTIRNGVIVSILFPVLGVVWGITLLVRSRAKEGLIVLAVALALGGAYALIYTQVINPKPSAYDSSVQSDVENEIRDRAGSTTGSTSVSDVSCVAKSESEMKCLADISADDGSQAQASYVVTLDRSDGSFIIDQPRVVETQGPGDELTP